MQPATISTCGAQASDNGGSSSSDFGPFSGFENWSSLWLSRGNLDIKIMIDDVTLWSKFESTC